MPITKATASSIAPAAKGDLVVGSATNDASVLAVGSANQVLTVDSSTSTGLKWAAPSAGALTKIASGSFSNVATVDIDSVFSSTYSVYQVIIRMYAADGSDDPQLQFRHGSTTITSHYGSVMEYNRNNALTTSGYTNTTQATLASGSGDGVVSGCSFTIYFSQVGISSTQPAFWGKGLTNGNAQAAVSLSGVGVVSPAQTFTGFRLKSASSNITGNYAIYGLEN